MYASDRGRKLGPNNLKGTKLGSPSWESGPESGPHRELRVELSRCSGLLRAAQARNSLAQPQLRAAYSSLRLQSRVLRSQSGNGIWRGQVWCASILASREAFPHAAFKPFIYGISLSCIPCAILISSIRCVSSSPNFHSFPIVLFSVLLVSTSLRPKGRNCIWFFS